MVNAKQKGASFERTVCVDLSKWVSNGDREDLFWRSAMSGGRATVGRKNRGTDLRAQAGDVCLVADHAGAAALVNSFYIECKHLASIRFRDLVFDRKSGLPEIWQTACRESGIIDKMPMLIARANRFPTFVGVNAAGASSYLFDSVKALATFHTHNLCVFDYNALLRTHYKYTTHVGAVVKRRRL